MTSQVPPSALAQPPGGEFWVLVFGFNAGEHGYGAAVLDWIKSRLHRPILDVVLDVSEPVDARVHVQLRSGQAQSLDENVNNLADRGVVGVGTLTDTTSATTANGFFLRVEDGFAVDALVKLCQNAVLPIQSGAAIRLKCQQAERHHATAALTRALQLGSAPVLVGSGAVKAGSPLMPAVDAQTARDFAVTTENNADLRTRAVAGHLRCGNWEKNLAAQRYAAPLILPRAVHGGRNGSFWRATVRDFFLGMTLH